jgi:hypothetical protein
MALLDCKSGTRRGNFCFLQRVIEEILSLRVHRRGIDGRLLIKGAVSETLPVSMLTVSCKPLEGFSESLMTFRLSLTLLELLYFLL